MRRKLLALGLLVVLVPLLVFARTPWPEGAKRAYIDRCAESMTSQGLGKSAAVAYYSCISEEMSNEFGMEEYDPMMKATPNPKGSDYDRRFYKVFTGCSSALPR